ncbi:MAG: hypothetical protein UX26_C0034G0004 [Parcubacteria group bacterium GW2011_GWC1_45_9]|nr:MAG: hypothetical protein UW89_C0016G0008 [Parcubacteria group bacterium GW2011_GWB1_45_10]KKU16142.1 MAG: hypothetical protein UX26_C0034G0004 [Parcubacteria group bacterium GW2011_GWC1_45_9]HCI05452.1 SAM-dependent methyltransferase [Patescibacteria group bacterium]
MEKISVEHPQNWREYELLDSGNCKKLERFGDFKIIRPDPRALWSPSLPRLEWDKASASFQGRTKDEGKWSKANRIPEKWQIHYEKLAFLLKFSNFKNIGIFPEQAVNWEWLRSLLRNTERSRSTENKPLKVLNLFAYTGAASVVCAKAGSEVVHVDSVRSVNFWAKQNAELNNIPAGQIRFLEDDAFKFVAREAKRGNKYDGIIMDPPRFGHGLKGEIWKLAFDLPKLVFECQKILSPNPLFFLINVYTADLSSIALANLLQSAVKKPGGTISAGELALKEKSAGRFLPSGIFARWSKN